MCKSLEVLASICCSNGACIGRARANKCHSLDLKYCKSFESTLMTPSHKPHRCQQPGSAWNDAKCDYGRGGCCLWLITSQRGVVLVHRHAPGRALGINALNQYFSHCGMNGGWQGGAWWENRQRDDVCKRNVINVIAISVPVVDAT